MTGSWKGRGNQYIELVKVLYCKLPTDEKASNYQLSHSRSGRELNSDLRGGRRECYHSATVSPSNEYKYFEVFTLFEQIYP